MTLTISGAIMLPPLRRQLKTLTNKNQALQDILSTCTAGTRLIGVEKVDSKVHNTKITVSMPDGRERVHFYNRVDIANVIPEDFVYSPTIPETVAKLNILGLDFHESDFLLDNGKITLNPLSLGYYGGITVEESITAILDHQGGLVPSLYLDWTGMIDGLSETKPVYHLYTFTLKIGSRPEPIVFTYTRDDETTLQQYNSNSNGFLAAWLSEKWNTLDLYKEMSLMISSQDSPGFMVQNLLNKPNSFELVVTREATLSPSGPVITQTPLRMGRYDMLPFGERIAPEALFYPESISMVDSTTHYDSNERVFKRNGVRPSLFEVSVNEREYVEVEGDEFSVDMVDMVCDNYLEHIVYNALTAAGYGNMFGVAAALTLHNASLDYLSIKIRATFGNEVLVVFSAELGTLRSQVDAEVPMLH